MRVFLSKKGKKIARTPAAIGVKIHDYMHNEVEKVVEKWKSFESQ